MSRRSDKSGKNIFDREKKNQEDQVKEVSPNKIREFEMKWKAEKEILKKKY